MQVTGNEGKTGTNLPERGKTDWATVFDLHHRFELEQSAYGNEARSPTIVRTWCERNPHICRVLYNKADWNDFWGTIVMLPLKEETIFQLLRQKIKDVDLNQAYDILMFV